MMAMEMLNKYYMSFQFIRESSCACKRQMMATVLPEYAHYWRGSIKRKYGITAENECRPKSQ